MHLQIWYIDADYFKKGRGPRRVEFRVLVASQKSGRRIALNAAKRSEASKLLRLKNFRTGGRTAMTQGLLEWKAPKAVKNKYYKLRTRENAAVHSLVMEEVRKHRSFGRTN